MNNLLSQVMKKILHQNSETEPSDKKMARIVELEEPEEQFPTLEENYETDQ